VSFAVALGGCSTVGTGGRVGLGPPSTPAVAAPAVATPPAPPVFGAFLDGPAGSKLPEADRTAALAAEDGAIASGERRTWKGAKGVYGFVVPTAGAVAASAAPVDGSPAECRGFTHTIYFAGRPQTGKGTGCRDADGVWHVIS
jgi:surface antigen